MSDFQNNLINQQQRQPQMNFPFQQNDLINQMNQIQNNKQSHFFPFPQPQINPNQNYNNINMNQNMNNNNQNSNINNMNNINNINLNFNNSNEMLNKIQPQIPEMMNMKMNMEINPNNININNIQPQQEEQHQNESSKIDDKIDNTDNTNVIANNNSIPVSKQNKKEESPLSPTKKLENKFSFWYRIDDTVQYQSQKQVMEKEKYESQVKKIAEFDTIEDFWGIFQHLRKPDSCHAGIEYFMFKEPIKPMWEDENNKNGGRFSIKLKHGYTTIIWEEMIFALIGGILPKEMKEQINGIVVTSRREFNTLQIWFKNYDEKITEDLERCIRDLLVIQDEVKLEKKQFNKKDYANNNNPSNNNNNKSGGYHNRGYNNNTNNNNYGDNGHGPYYKEHKKSKHQFNRK